ncbi:MAG: hypothetical protein LAO55_18805 [Acidobacteriia bacterium]|nr:hypothetical protein [Terriglobia bacterium]
MKVYKRETTRAVNRLLHRELSFPDCISTLDAALARFIPRMKPEHLDELRAVMLANNETVMKEMERRPLYELGSRGAVQSEASARGRL